jgi:hypothetical protein
MRAAGAIQVRINRLLHLDFQTTTPQKIL